MSQHVLCLSSLKLDCSSKAFSIPSVAEARLLAVICAKVVIHPSFLHMLLLRGHSCHFLRWVLSLYSAYSTVCAKLFFGNWLLFLSIFISSNGHCCFV